MIVTTENQDLLLEAAARVLDVPGFPRDATALGFADEQGMIAVAVFHNISADHADVQLARTPGRRLTGAVFKIIGKVAFDPAHLGVSALWLPVADRDAKAQIAALKIGFRFEARRRGYSATGDDVILMSLRRDTIPTFQALATPDDERAQERPHALAQ